MPSFIKIDVEGFEDQVLAGLTRQVPALSFEFTTIAREIARFVRARGSSNSGPTGSMWRWEKATACISASRSRRQP